MRFLADENIPLASVRRLRDAGHDVAAVSEGSPGASDSEVLTQATRQSRVILTFDRDYGTLVYREVAPAPTGVVYYRFAPRSPEEPAERLLGLLMVPSLVIEGRFTVVERTQTRQRSLP
jgi:predicted nuclease of predicted toxin-antitoxin system